MKIFDKNSKQYENLDKSKFVLNQVDTKLYDTKFETEPISFGKDVLIRFCKNKASVVAFIIICIIVFFALFGPMMNPYAFDQQFNDYIDMPPKIPALSAMGIFNGGRVLENRRVEFLTDTEYYPNDCVLRVFNERTINNIEMVDVEVDFYKYTNCTENFWFGTDYLGRDLWTRMWRGARVSLIIALVSVTCNVFIGIIYGSISGYYGGRIDNIMMRFTEVINAFPRIVIITLFIMIAGTGMFSIIMALVIKGWVGTARTVRSQFFRYKGREYVLAARTLGVKDMSLIFKHILPNAIGPTITASMIAVPSAIFAESFLAYIGLGLQAPEPSIGVLLSQGQKVLLHFPTQVLFPGILISVLMIAFNLFANGLRDAFDPTLRGAL